MSAARAAQWVGQQYARAGRPITDCPYKADGTPEQRVQAARFVQGYLDERPASGVDYSGEGSEE